MQHKRYSKQDTTKDTLIFRCVCPRTFLALPRCILLLTHEDTLPSVRPSWRGDTVLSGGRGTIQMRRCVRSTYRHRLETGEACGEMERAAFCGLVEGGG